MIFNQMRKEKGNYILRISEAYCLQIENLAIAYRIDFTGQ